MNDRILRSTVTMRRLALASLVMNVVIVVTGGAVRLTGSGLGCPTWPSCDGTSYVTTPAMGWHGVIEFTNRTLTGVVGVLAAAALLVALFQARGPRRRRLVYWSAAVLASIPAQAALGGLTVLTHLNPWFVAAHFLLSSGVIFAAYELWARAGDPLGHTAADIPAALRALGWAIVGVTAAVLVAGAVVTGSGPHAGDEHAKRTGLDPAMVAQLHTDLVMLLIGLSVAAWLALRATSAPAGAVRAAVVLVAIEVGQAAIGFVQYFTHLPVVLVGVHMLGACLVLLAALRLATHASPPRILGDDVPAYRAVPASRTPASV